MKLPPHLLRANTPAVTMAVAIIAIIALTSAAALLPAAIAAQNGKLETFEYTVSPSQITAKSYIGAFKRVNLELHNKRQQPIEVAIAAEGPVTELLTISNASVTIKPLSNQTIALTFLSSKPGNYNGTIHLLGAIKEKIPALIKVADSSIPANELLSVEVEAVEKKIKPGKPFKAIVNLQNLLSEKTLNVYISYFLKKEHGESARKSANTSQTEGLNAEGFTTAENLTLNTSLSLLRVFEAKGMSVGDYVLELKVDYSDVTITAATRFTVAAPMPDRKLFGMVALKHLLLAMLTSILSAAGFRLYKKRQAAKKRYVSKISFSQLPKPGSRSLSIGKIAETTRKAYFDIDQLAMHTLIAGSTGGGKTVSAEVLVEEALLHGAAVIVFDPTAQWTGFLRKNTEKKMLNIYPQFGMKPTDARSFSGNVRQIMNAREVIDIKKFMSPGEITCFAINRLDPEDIDIVVANTVRQVFKANLPEAQGLKLMVIFDEVHRLLPKFGGSGQGFLQIERAAREFRKWGVGLMLISQVLTDFASEVKANIATEIQMRTRDQGDLDRIKTKYGDYMLQSLLKAATGTGMIENPSYNKGEPFFVSFRPLMHNHAALPDEELESYNKYNLIIDEIEFQLEQLKAEGVDTFDIALELKLAKDKLKLGNFNMVDIYVESLKPRLEGEWKKLGKQPKQYAAQVLSEAEMQREYEAAVKARQKITEEEEKKAQKKDETAGKPDFKPLRLKTGLVVLNPRELEDAIQTMSEDAFSFHLNENKNDFADWAKEPNPALSGRLKQAKTKDDVLKALQESASPKAEAKKGKQ